MEIRSATISDLEGMAGCHISAFPNSLSSALGKSYVARMLSWYLASNDTFLFYLVQGDTVIGYCGGMVKRPGAAMGSASGMAQHSFAEAVKAFMRKPWLLFHREVRSKYPFIFKNLTRKMKQILRLQSLKSSPVMVESSGEKAYAALIVIGVTQQFQNRGIGSLLMTEFEKKSINLGLKKMLLTVKTDNTQAIKSYEKSGWRKTEEKSGSTTMIKILS